MAIPENIRKFAVQKFDAAYRAQERYGIPHLFALAQWGLESGWGKSAPGNNFFGIKATSSWKGKTQLLWTTEYINGVKQSVQRSFRAYDTWDEAVEDWVKIIQLPRYSKAFQYKNDPKAFAREIAAGGYATSPTYASVIAGLIDHVKEATQGLTPKKKA